MPRQSRVERKLLDRERRFEREYKMKVKRSEEYEALEEVFDKPTLMLIYSMLNRGILSELGGVVSTGKESRVYHGKRDGREVAVKIYLTGSAEFRKGMMPYIAGDYRFSRVKRDTRSLVSVWARKEFVNLREFMGAGVPVPEPLHVERNVLVMRFIGEGGVRAPLLSEVELPDPSGTYESLIGFVRLMVEKARLVHGDLSEYNVNPSRSPTPWPRSFWRGTWGTSTGSSAALALTFTTENPWSRS
ncbi:MAG: serine protein kinase RIO [Candidatus Brockarchaeota archaeon]|nr:serine protein kinase RIO [Candidatus Brockarchaeota archaeon]